MQKALATVFKRSQTDVEFRNLCLNDPEQAIYEITGKKLPARSAIQFQELEDAVVPHEVRTLDR